MLGPPCASFSEAHRIARALRSRRFPWGRPGLSTEQLAVLADGNRCARATLAIMRDAMKYSIPFILEQPVGSTMRWLPELRRLMKLEPERFTEYIIDQCAFGAPHRKRTWLVCFRIEDPGMLECVRPCLSRGGICASTGLPHVQLVGSRRTSAAAAYPRLLCDALGKALCSRGQSSLAAWYCDVGRA